MSQTNHRDLHALHALVTDDSYWERQHAIVDAAPEGTFSPLARSEYDEKLAEFDRDIVDTEVELERREVQRRVDTEAELLAQLDRRAEETLKK